MRYLFLFCILIISGVLFAQNKSTFIYSIKGADTLRMDVYSPSNLDRNDSLPVLLWMHGGGFAGGSRDNGDEVKLAKYATNHGYIGISISYRLTRKGTESGFGCDCPAKDKIETFRGATIDFLDAAQFVIENNRKLKVNANKIIAGGSSAGAEAVLSAVYMKDYYVTDKSKYQDIHFAGLLSLAGAMVDPSYISLRTAVPTVLFHGSEDNLVPFAKGAHHQCSNSQPGFLILYGSEVISTKLRTLGKSFYFNEVKGGKHEISGIPFVQLDEIFKFFNSTIFQKEIIQTKRIIDK
jgi:acetyl esterase/lipase